MEFKLFNTLGRRLEILKPEDDNTLRFYCCGPTVYGPAHIGNFRTFVIQDLCRRVVESIGHKTLHVRNITDVDDKTIRQAVNSKKPLQSVTDYWRKQFENDCKKLNLLPPHENPSAVEHISEQIGLIRKLVAKNLAYVATNGSVYFRISNYKDYGKLSGKKGEGLQKNADRRLSDADEYDKESWQDFVLWKSKKPDDGENYWESPWGLGRPGWHIECSAMAIKYLGESFDMHSGGIDLCFPHHENEIAQSEGVTGKTFARHWFHIDHLRVEGRKMSKSIGNLFLIDDIESWGFHPMELRYVLLSGHYRQTFNFTREALSAARKVLHRFAFLHQQLDCIAVSQEALKPKSWGSFSGVRNALLDDLNVSKALGELHIIATKVTPKIKNQSFSIDDKRDLQVGLFLTFDTLGIDLRPFYNDYSDHKTQTIPSEIERLANRRWEAKKSRKWELADNLRKEIMQFGWIVKDNKVGFDLSKK